MGTEQAGRGVELLQRVLNRIAIAEPLPVTGLSRNTATPHALRRTLAALEIKGSAREPAVQAKLLEAAASSQRRPPVAFDVSSAALRDPDTRYAHELLLAVGRDDPTLLERAVERLVPPALRRKEQGILKVDAPLLTSLGSTLRRHGLGADASAVRELRALDGGRRNGPSFDEARAVLSVLFDVSYSPEAFFTRDHDHAFRSAAAATGRPPRVEDALLRALVAQETQFRPTTRQPEHDDDPVGPLQIKPRAARAVGVIGDLTDTHTNLRAGALYLVSLQDRHGARTNAALISAWNAGPNRGAVGATSTNEAPDLTITQHYLRRVIAFRAIYEAQASEAARLTGSSPKR